MTKPGRIALIAAVTLLVSPAGPSLADTASKAAMAAFEKRFDAMDVNGDGKIDRAEYVEYEIKKANERFDVADENGDGLITRKEAERAMKKKQEQLRKSMREWKQQKDKGKPPSDKVSP
jgi:Ca2+-binding EF-hand superfamily protein